LAKHVLRVALPLVPVAAAAGGIAAGLARAGLRSRLPAEVWCALLISAAIVVQPLVISPHFPGFAANEERLSALGLVPLCVALACLLRAAGDPLRTAPAWGIGAAAAALLAGSLQYNLVAVGP